MKHLLLTQLDCEINQMINGFEKLQALTLAGLSISRLWHPYEVWTSQHKATKLTEWGKACVDILWEQISMNQLFGSKFEQYYKYLDKIDAKIERFEDNDVIVDGSIAFPLMETLDMALCCFFDPKLLPGLQRNSFWSDITAIVGQGAEYIYDTVFSDAEETCENTLNTIIASEPRWIAELSRIREDVSFLKLYQQDKAAIFKRREGYLKLDIFSQV